MQNFFDSDRIEVEEVEGIKSNKTIYVVKGMFEPFELVWAGQIIMQRKLNVK